MKINKEGIALIKSFEGCRLHSYKDAVGIWTIGYGHTGEEVTQDLNWTQKDADTALLHDIERFEVGVEKLLTGPTLTRISSNQFSAVVCFAFNVGLQNLKESLLLRCINKGNFKDAAAQFARWNKAGGQVLAGLTRRRAAERDLFESP